jgi:hypothetical protein
MEMIPCGDPLCGPIPRRTFEDVQEMIRAHLEENRIRRQENESRIAARRFTGRYTGSRF